MLPALWPAVRIAGEGIGALMGLTWGADVVARQFGPSAEQRVGQAFDSAQQTVAGLDYADAVRKDAALSHYVAREEFMAADRGRMSRLRSALDADFVMREQKVLDSMATVSTPAPLEILMAARSLTKL